MAIDNDKKDLDGLAAEYVLGTLSVDEKQHVEELLLEDKEFQKEVAFWEKQLAPMIDTIENVEPPSNSFEKIMTRVQALPSNVLTVDFKQKVQFWKVSAIAASIIALCLFVTILGREITRPSEQSFVAVLEAENKSPAFVASVDIKRQVVHVLRMTSAPDKEKSYELWALGAGRKAPQSIGLVDENMSFKAQKLGQLDSGRLINTTLAVSLEPKGGSPTGKVTGPVLFTGKLVPLPKN